MIKLTTDSTCDLSAELVERYGICATVPLDVNLGEQNLKDGTFEISEIYDFVKRTKKLPKTSAVNVFDFEEVFKKLTADGSSVLHFSISSKLSASCQNAAIAAAGLKNVYVVDSKQLSTGTSLLMLAAYDMIKNKPEMTAKQAADILNGMAEKVQTSFCVDTINYLYKGGRCSALALLGANLLKIHPSLHLRDGFIKVGKKYRGKMTAIFGKYIEDLKADNPNYDDTRCFITYTHGTSPEVIEEARARTKEFFKFKEIHETTAGATVTSHCGAGTLGLLFMNK